MASQLLLPLIAIGAEPPFFIEVLDEATGRGVPLVELRTVNHVSYWTDSAGIAAINEPAWNGETIYFHVASQGYEFPKDGFGFRGKAFKIESGRSVQIKLKRINIAERLYRVTGEGIYRDSMLVGQPAPIERPTLNVQVMGSDSVVSAIYRGQLYWFWGDTNRASYPLGNYSVPGATSKLPTDGGLDPWRGVNLNYFVGEQGFAKPMAPMPGSGPTWIDGLTVLKSTGEEQMFAAYVKVKPPLTVYERGLARFGDQKQAFVQESRFDLDTPAYPAGHTFPHRDGDVEYIYFATPYPLTRVRANAVDWLNVREYEAWTPLVEGSRWSEPKLDRALDGKLHYAWRKNTPPIDVNQENKLVGLGQIKDHERWLRLRDVKSGAAVMAHAASVAWNEYRRRWLMILVQHFGSSLLGEVWYAEADQPHGPWLHAVKIVTHEKYSFYNPKHHPYFDQDNGRRILFEGTYTQTFSGNPVATPRYDYNQIMYGLDLADERLKLPVEK